MAPVSNRPSPAARPPPPPPPPPAAQAKPAEKVPADKAAQAGKSKEATQPKPQEKLNDLHRDTFESSKPQSLTQAQQNLIAQEKDPQTQELLRNQVELQNEAARNASQSSGAKPTAKPTAKPDGHIDPVTSPSAGKTQTAQAGESKEATSPKPQEKPNNFHRSTFEPGKPRPLTPAEEKAIASASPEQQKLLREHIEGPNLEAQNALAEQLRQKQMMREEELTPASI